MRSRPTLAKRRSPKLILASASPRRKEILKAAGIEFDVLPTSVPERQRPNEPARSFARRMAVEKAQAARAVAGENCNRPILGADTVVVVGGKTLGKPASPEDARRMLRLLSGRRHTVMTALCLLHPSRSARSECKKDVRVASTVVKFRRLSAADIEEYIASGEYVDKAGAYAIQSRASKYIEWIHGCYFNVVGLPVSMLYDMLQDARMVTPQDKH